MEKQTKLIFKRKIIASLLPTPTPSSPTTPSPTPTNKSNAKGNADVNLPYLVLEKLHGYMGKKSFKRLSSTCKYYRNYYAKEMNKYWFEMYSKKYDKKNVEEKHGSKITCECSTYLKEAHMKQVKIRSAEVHKQIEEMQKQYKIDKYKKADPPTNKYKVYKLEDFQKVIKSDDNESGKDNIKWLTGLLIKLCKNKKHIIYEYDYEKYDKNHDYFIRYLNAKQEKEYLSRYNKYVTTNNGELKKYKAEVKRAESEIIYLNKLIEEYQTKIVTIKEKINTANTNHTKIIEKGWDIQFYPTVTSIVENLSK
jgi:hypothetical protein